VERIVHSQERLELMEALKHIPQAVEEETMNLADAVLRFKPAENEWSIREVVGHLRDKAELWTTRLYMVATQTDPILPVFDGEKSVRDHNYHAILSLTPLIDEMRTNTLRTVELLEHQPDWSRLGRHPEIGRRSLHQWAAFLLAGEIEHLEQIANLKQQATAASSA
jgi:hypothetical protein